MASFAQNQPTQFNPFIAPTDLQAQAQRDQQQLQAEVIVGSKKQEMYNINAQKIQGMVDSIAGLQVSKDVDKQYLNQSMGQLRNDLQTLVKSDFSKMQIFNQAGSMASRIGSDPKIQNAVISTQHEQDAIAQIQDAQKNGKGSPTNDHMILRQIEQWRNDQTPGATLGKQTYTPFFDYQKGFQDFMKDKHGNVVVRQDPLSKNADGTPNWSAYALVEGKEVKLDPLEVQRDAQTYFQSNAQALGQLDIDSVYFSDKTDNQTAFQRYQLGNRQELSVMENEIKRLNSDSALNPLNAKDNQDKITQYQDAISKRQALHQKNEQAFLQNPDQAKKSFFQDQILQGFGNRFAYQDIENKVVKNPIFDAQMEEGRFDLQKQKFQWEQETWMKDFDQKERKMLADEKNAKISAGILVGGDYNAAAAEAITPQQYRNDLKVSYQEVSQEQLKTMYGTGAYPDLVELAGSDSNGNPLYKLRDGVSQQQREAAWKSLAASYETNPAAANRWVKSYFDNPNNSNSGIGKEKVTFARLRQVDEIEKTVDNQFKNDPSYRAYKEIEKNLGDPNQVFGYVSNDDGSRTPITRSDIIKYNQIFNGAKDIELPERTKNAIENISYKQNNPGYSGNRDLTNESARIGDLLLKNKEVYNKYTKTITQSYKNIMLNTSQFSVGEDISRSGKLPAIQASLLNDQDATNRLNAVTGEKGAGKITLITRKDPVTGEYTAFVRNEKGTQEHFNINPTFASTLAPELTRDNPYSAWQNLLDANRRGKGTPSTTGVNGATSYVPKGSLLKKYDVRYQVSDDGGSRYSPDIQYRVKGTNQWYPYPFSDWFNDPAKVETFMNQIVTKGGGQADQFFEETLR